MTLITGNTYPVREQLKALGGKWDPTAKGWLVPDEKADEARLLVSDTVASPSPRSGGSRRYRRRNDDDRCELCGKNKFTCGHCIGW